MCKSTLDDLNVKKKQKKTQERNYQTDRQTSYYLGGRETKENVDQHLKEHTRYLSMIVNKKTIFNSEFSSSHHTNRV